MGIGVWDGNWEKGDGEGGCEEVKLKVLHSLYGGGWLGAGELRDGNGDSVNGHWGMGWQLGKGRWRRGM